MPSVGKGNTLTYPVSRFGHLEFNESQPLESAGRGRRMTDVERCIGEADAAFARGEFESALRWYGRVLEFEALNEGSWAGQVRSLLELGQYKEANVWADKALERFPDSPLILSAKAVALGRMGRAAEAMPFSDAALEKPGEQAWIWLARGDVLLAAGQRQVDACFDRAMRLAPGDWLTRWLAARIRNFWKQFAMALAHARDAAALAPERVMVWVTMAECQAALGLMEAARQSIGQALVLVPDHPPASEVLRGIHEAGWMGGLHGLIRRWSGRP